MNEQNKNQSLAAIVLIGLTVFLYQVADVIGKIQSWEVIWNPPTVSHMLVAVASALVAIAGALKLDLALLRK